MHELSVAMSLIDVITETLIRNQVERAKSVTIEVGPLSGVLPEALKTAFIVATRGTELAGTDLRIVETEVVIRCASCEADQKTVSETDLRCVVCKTPGATVVHGRELDVVSIEVENG